MRDLSEKNEVLELRPRVVIEVFRHDEKDTAQDDSLAPLTSKGRENALRVGRSKNPKINQSYVISSPRDRALHSGLLQCFGEGLDEKDVADKSLSDLLHLVRQRNKHDQVKIDDRLNFQVEAVPEFNDRFYDEYGKKDGNRTLYFQLDNSDQLILDIAKKTSPPAENADIHEVTKIKGYTQMVGDLAEIFLEYSAKLEVWKKVYEEDPSKFESPDLQIFIATHSQNLECFLMDVIRRLEGEAALDKFLKGLSHHKSFLGYSEGCQLLIEGAGIELDYKGKIYHLEKTDLQAMVVARNQFNQKVRENLMTD